MRWEWCSNEAISVHQFVYEYDIKLSPYWNIKDQRSKIKGTQYDKRYTLESIPDIEYKRHPNVVKWSLLGKYENDGIERVELTLRWKWLR